MNKISLLFSAEDQNLTAIEVPRLAQETVDYVEATFSLGANWDGFDSVRAVWTDGIDTISTVLDNGYCKIPSEVLSRKSVVKVNLVGSVVENDILVERLTTEQIIAIVVKKTALIEGSETEPITPSQFEQYVAQVHNLREEAEQIIGAEAQTLEYRDETKIYHDAVEDWTIETRENAEKAARDADRAEQAAGESGYMFFEIDSDGHLIYFRTASVDVDFYLEDGHLYLEEVTNGN